MLTVPRLPLCHILRKLALSPPAERVAAMRSRRRVTSRATGGRSFHPPPFIIKHRSSLAQSIGSLEDTQVLAAGQLALIRDTQTRGLPIGNQLLGRNAVFQRWALLRLDLLPLQRDQATTVL